MQFCNSFLEYYGAQHYIFKILYGFPTLKYPFLGITNQCAALLTELSEQYFMIIQCTSKISGKI